MDLGLRSQPGLFVPRMEEAETMRSVEDRVDIVGGLAQCDGLATQQTTDAQDPAVEADAPGGVDATYLAFGVLR